MSDKKPVIFVSYSHKDEPEQDPDGNIHWLRDILSYVAPAVNGTYELWTDEDITGGADWESNIKEKLAACDICILLVSRHSLASKYVIEVEIDTILKRQQRGDAVALYPIVLSPFPQAAAPASLLALNLRPRLDKPLSGFSRHHRATEISKIADEIVGILRSKTADIADVRIEPPKPPAFVHITGLPETAYEHLVGREVELKRLDDAWVDRKANIISLIAEGGAGKSALVNEWLTRLRDDNYRGAESVLGWSFYSQGTKERATSAEQFLNWAIEKLGIRIETTSATAKGEAIAEEMMKHRVLLVLDGCEPLQHGLDKQQGELKDLGLRALLRRFAPMPPTETHGLVVLTSRLPIKDIARWNESAAPVIDVEQLSDDAGAALLRDNGVWGTDKELQATASDFGGHPLALGLLASFLTETQAGDVRRRDHVGALVSDDDNPRHGHAKRVMESYEKEWLSGQPTLLSIMYLVGLFDRPAGDDCLKALRENPAIDGLTDAIVNLGEDEWQRAVARLRQVRLLAPIDPSAPDALDAHPLLREWFGERLRETSEGAWKAAHSRLFEHLRDTTKEGETPTLENLAPLYQAVAHGCRAGRHQEALDKIYAVRICRRDSDGSIAFYTMDKLGAFGSDLAAISWFFDQPYKVPVITLDESSRSWVLSVAAFSLRAQGRSAEALPAMRIGFSREEQAEDWSNAAITASNLSDIELLVGEVIGAVTTGEQAVALADRGGKPHLMIAIRTTYADALHAIGRRKEAECLFGDANRRQEALTPHCPYLTSLPGYRFSDLLLAKGNFVAVRDRSRVKLEIARTYGVPLFLALETLALARALLGSTLEDLNREIPRTNASAGIQLARALFDESIDNLRAAGHSQCTPSGFLFRAAFRRSIGDLDGAARDLDEVEEIAELGPMKLFLSDMALERARLAFAKIEAFAPLNRMISDGPSKPIIPPTAVVVSLKKEAAKQLVVAADYIKTCGYHRRDEELAELEAVLRGEKKFAELPSRV
ncbi:MAG: hypothetical protein QOJ86_307 [Bradyrhizobium sp.]|nr:hypothetical protein [Bradyrhizobium sp.]